MDCKVLPNNRFAFQHFARWKAFLCLAAKKVTE